MKKTCLLVLFALFVAGFLWSQTTMHYWSFNNGENSALDAGNNLPTAIPADFGDGVINHELFFNSFTGSPINAEPGFDAGQDWAVATAVNIGEYYEVVFSSEGYENIIFSFAGQASATGYNDNTIEVSSDGGTTWEEVESGFSMTTTRLLYTFNLTTADGNVDDNSDFDIIVRYTFDVDGVTGGGNNRFDNIKISGTPLIQVLSISNISQSPVNVTSSDEVSVQADVTEGDVAIETVELRWGTVSGTYPETINMILSRTSGTYIAVSNIPSHSDGTTVYYKVYAEDVNEVSTTSPEQSYTVWDPQTTTLPYTETFDTDLGDCYNYTVTGSNPWHHSSSSARCDGFGGQATEEHWLVLPGINFNDYTNVVMSFTNYARYGTIDESNYLKLFYSSNYSGIGDPYADGVAWNELVFNQPPPGNIGNTEIQTHSGIIDLSPLTGDNIYIAFKYYSTNSPTAWRVDDINIYEALSPLLTVVPTSLSGFTYHEGDGPSASQSYTLSGINLEPANDEITVSGNEYFEVSTDDTDFYPSVQVPYAGDELTATTIYVRLIEDLDEGVYENEDIINSGGGDSKIVTVSGSVTPPPAPGYFVDFEGPGETKFSYAAGNVTLSGLDWNFAEAGIWEGQGGDMKNGERSARLRHPATIKMIEDKADGMETISFYYARSNFSQDREPVAPVFVVEYSTDQGSTWIQVGDDIDLDGVNDLTLFSESVYISGNIRVQIRSISGTNGRRFNIDDISITDYIVENQVAIPTFDPPAGTFYEPINVEISTTTEDATVFYRFDPEDDWETYTVELTIDETTTIWAYAEAEDMVDSPVASATYTFPLPSFTSLPYIETFDTDLGDCYVYNVSGPQTWGHATFGGNGYAEMNGHGSTVLEEDWLILPGINMDEYDSVVMSFETAYNFGISDEDNYLKLYYSTDYYGVGDPTSAIWNEIPFTQPATDNYTWASSGDLDLSALEGTVWLGFKYHYLDNYRLWQIDNISISSGPLLSVNPTTLSGFSYIEGFGPSASQSFFVSGSNLQSSRDNITVAGSTNFEVSLDDNSFSSTVQVPFSDGELSETAVFVRLTAGLEQGSYDNEIINVSGGGAEPAEVNVSGDVLTLPPGIPYTENFQSFVFEQNTVINTFGEQDEWLFGATGTAPSRLEYLGDWGSGTGAGFRGNANVMGYQHTAGTGVFTASLSLINDTGSTLNQLYISYKGMVERTAADRSPEWTVTLNGIEIPGLSYSTIGGENETKSVTIEDLNIVNGETFTIVWSSDRGEPLGASKQIGISNVVVAETELVLPPTFSPPESVIFHYSVEVELSTLTEDAAIFYSYIGPPNYNWVEYVTPLEFDNTTTVWAYAAKDGLTNSSITSATYTFYYDSAEGMTGNYLWSELTNITSADHVQYSYDAARFYMHGYIDNIDGQVRCIFTGQWVDHPYGSLATPPDFSAEHTYCQSWYQSDLDPEGIAFAVSDLHALHPARMDVNSARSNRPVDYVTDITSIWGFDDYLSYVGFNPEEKPVFDVADEFKGNFARAILYFAVRYYDDDSNFTRGFQMESDNEVDQLPILLQWHLEDPVDTREIERNELVYAYQGNRNPFIDRPEFVALIWGELDLAAPIVTAATNISVSSFTANWNPVPGALSYRLDVSESSDFAGFVDGYKNIVVDNTSYYVTGLEPGTDYYYRVRAVAADGTISLNSDTISVLSGGTLLYYWNFNENVPESGINWAQPIPAFIGDGSITYTFENAVSFGGTTINGIPDEENGGSFVPQAGTDLINNGRHFDLDVPTTGYNNIILRYPTRRTSTGFTTQEVQYTLDGLTWTPKEIVDVSEFDNNWLVGQVVTIDFSGIAGVANNPDFKIRIVLDGGSHLSGNNRFDNIRVIGTEISDVIDPPANVEISITENNVIISWDTVPGATTYIIEAADDPYGEYADVTSSGDLVGTTWTGPLTEERMFYRVKASTASPPTRR